MHNDCAEVDELLLELADYKNDCADVADRNCAACRRLYEEDECNDCILATDFGERLRSGSLSWVKAGVSF
jgi:hypothetical protein